MSFSLHLCLLPRSSYLALFRTPVRELCLDAVEELWRNSEYFRFDDCEANGGR
jgi:hypothetical protein